jgi:transketolase
MTVPQGAEAAAAVDLARLEELGRRIRVEIIRTVNHTQVGHVGGPLSAADILAVLYFKVLRLRPNEPGWSDRDRFILSKGHSSLVQYSAMALRGYFPVDELRTFDSQGSRLQGHPDMRLLPGIDISTGSLGMGLSAGLGMALGSRLAKSEVRAFVLLGDGECQEGQVWEAAFVAARYGVDNLIAIVDHNKLQQYGWPGESLEVRLPPEEPGVLVEKWGSFGWRVLEVDGHDVAALVDTFDRAVEPTGQPTVVIAHTVKGQGVSFMAGDYRWHSKPITPAEFSQAMAELGEPAE